MNLLITLKCLVQVWSLNSVGLSLQVKTECIMPLGRSFSESLTSCNGEL